jgi:uncharacterized protein (TIGR03437 family)
LIGHMPSFSFRAILPAFCGLALTFLAPPCRAQFVTSYNISTLAGTGTSGYSGDSGAAGSAELYGPVTVAVDPAGKLYVSDQLNHVVRTVSTGGGIAAFAGDNLPGYTGDGAAATSAELYSPSGIAFDTSGNIFICDSRTNVIRKVTSAGVISTVAGSYIRGPGFSGDGGLATDAQMSGPTGIAIDKAGNIYVADTGNNRIRKFAVGGNIATIAGGITASFSGDGARASLSRLNAPRGLALDGAGNLYIADTGNNRIRKIGTDGNINTIAGNGTAGFAGDGGPAVSASLRAPQAVAVDGAGVVYIADYSNSRIRRIALSGAISTIAGNGRFSYTGDGGAALTASFNFPSGVAVASNGNVYVADFQNNVVRLLTPNETSSAVPAIDLGGVVSAAAFGGFTTAAPGSWIEIYGADLAGATKTWDNDFKANAAPTWLSGTSVTVGGQAAALSYISPRQINAQVPSTVTAGAQDIVITSDVGVSKPYSLTVKETEPGLYSPAQFSVGGKAYLGALFTDYSLAQIPGTSVGSRRVRPGDTILLYGVGFGSVTPDIPSGQLVTKINALLQPVQFFFGGVQATTSYAGLAPNQIGLYQFNVLVPNVAASDAVPVTFTQGGRNSTQTVYIAVQ